MSKNCSVDDYVDYDSDYEAKVDAGRGIADVDPYAGEPFSACKLMTGLNPLEQVFSSQKIGEKRSSK